MSTSWLTSISVDVFDAQALLETTRGEIYTLPVELWAHICSFLSQDRHISTDIISLSHTNTYFRTLTLSIPSLWAKFELIGQCTDLLSEYIRRSQGLPGCTAVRKGVKKRKRVVQVVRQYGIDPARLHDLFIPRAQLTEALSVFTQLRRIDIVGTIENQTFSFSDILDALPYLRELVWRPTCWPHQQVRIPWARKSKSYGLEVLHIEERPRWARSLTQVQEILAHCPNLKELVVGITTWDAQELSSSSLQILRIRSQPAVCPPIIMHLPALKEVEFSDDAYNCHLANEDNSTGLEHSPLLEVLSTSLCVWNVQHCTRWLAAVGGSLKKLRIGVHVYSLDGFLQAMSAPDDEQKMICPCLEELLITPDGVLKAKNHREAVKLVTSMYRARTLFGLPRLKVKWGEWWLPQDLCW